MKVAIYCRLSEEDREKRKGTEDSASIQNQKTLLLQYAFAQGWQLYQIYSDDDYTGADRNRPAFRRLLEDAEAGKFDIILCKTQSRFTRELELVEKYIHGLFPLWGIRFVSVVDNADTENKGNKKSRQINGLVNEWYLEDMSENIRSVLKNRRENGYHIGATALYGYKKDPDRKGHLLIDEEAAEVVREVFTLFSQGYGKSAIARRLNDRGVPNPTEYKRQKGILHQPAKGKNSTLWKYSAIADMLENEMYIGNMVQGKYGSISYKTKQNKPRPKEQWYRVEGTHEAIIDRALWEKVKAMREERAKPFATGEIGIFSKKARCAACGYTMRSVKNKGRRYLTCPNRNVSKDACPGAFISVERLERMVVSELNRLLEAYLDQEELERHMQWDTNLQKQKKRILENRNAYEKKIKEYAKAIRNLYLDKGRGILSEEDFLEMTREFTLEKRRMAGMLLQAKEQLSEVEARIEAGDAKELMQQYINVDHLTREMVEKLVDHINVGRRIPGTRTVPVEIHWNF